MIPARPAGIPRTRDIAAKRVIISPALLSLPPLRFDSERGHLAFSAYLIASVHAFTAAVAAVT